MEYLVSDRKFNLSYQELREEYLKICEWDEDTFLDNASTVLHLTCIIFYLKEIPTSVALADDGLIHELVHWLDKVETVNDIPEIMALFKTQCKLD